MLSILVLSTILASAEEYFEGKCRTGRPGGRCDTRHVTEWDGCNKCANGYVWAGRNHWCCTQNDVQTGAKCMCGCISDDGEFDACVCVANGRSDGRCDRRKPVEEWDSCDRCRLGSRWAGANHWCCNNEDVGNHDDCICASDYKSVAMATVVPGEALTVEDYAVWLFAAVGLGATLYAAKSACTRTKTHQSETLEV